MFEITGLSDDCTLEVRHAVSYPHALEELQKAVSNDQNKEWDSVTSALAGRLLFAGNECLVMTKLNAEDEETDEVFLRPLTAQQMADIRPFFA